MAEDECIKIGSIVKCTTCFGEKYQGEVTAYDPIIDILILKSVAVAGRPSQSDMSVVNLKFIKDLEVQDGPNSSVPPIPCLDLYKLHYRVKENMDKKEKLLKAVRLGCTVDGQKIFSTVKKTMDDTIWVGADIVVMKEVRISPPYKPENVKSIKEDKMDRAVSHIRKIVDKYYKDQAVNGELATASGAVSMETTKP